MDLLHAIIHELVLEHWHKDGLEVQTTVSRGREEIFVRIIRR